RRRSPLPPLAPVFAMPFARFASRVGPFSLLRRLYAPVWDLVKGNRHRSHFPASNDPRPLPGRPLSATIAPHASMLQSKGACSADAGLRGEGAIPMRNDIYGNRPWGIGVAPGQGSPQRWPDAFAPEPRLPMTPGEVLRAHERNRLRRLLRILSL